MNAQTTIPVTGAQLVVHQGGRRRAAPRRRRRVVRRKRVARAGAAVRHNVAGMAGPARVGRPATAVPAAPAQEGYGVGSKIAAGVALAGAAYGAYNYGSQIWNSITGKDPVGGDYAIQNNTLLGSDSGSSPPQMFGNGSHIHIRHREYISDVYASNSFANIAYSINPGNSSCFPWLAQVATSYEKYKVTGMLFEYKSTSSDAVLSSGSSSALGTVIMATQYNAYDTAFSDKRTMENYEFSNSCKPSCNMYHAVECQPYFGGGNDWLYVSQIAGTTASAARPGDKRLYDLGDFNIAVTGCQNAGSSQVLGELWVSYDIVFALPKLLTDGALAQTDHYAITAATIANPLKTTVVQAGASIGVLTQAAGGVLFPVATTDGLFLVTYFYSGTVAGVMPSITIVPNANIVLPSYLANDSNYIFQAPESTNACMNVAFQAIVAVSQTSPGVSAKFTITMTGGALPTGTIAGDLIVTLIANTFN
nr:MAG: capsid protein [Cressdnaviricota sp.]